MSTQKKKAARAIQAETGMKYTKALRAVRMDDYAQIEQAALEALDDYQYGPNGQSLIVDDLGDPEVDTLTIIRLVLGAAGIRQG